MNNNVALCYLFLALLWNFKVIYATLCANGNGTSCCAGYQWDQIQERCLPCKLGYTGANCDTKCFYPSYGKDCQSICICSEFFCDHENGCRNLTNGDFQNICKGKNGGTVCCHGYKLNKKKTECEPCEKGYTGENCENACPFPTYGLDCQSICNCTELFCDHVNGCGNSTEKSFQNTCNGKNGTVCCYGYKLNSERTECVPCEEGYTGKNCEIVCPFPSYGLDCQSICNCAETTCDHVNGCRGYSSACDKGYKGQSCDVICPYPFHGMDCESICNCTETNCDHVNGCMELSTETPMPHNSMKTVNEDGFQKLSANRKQPLLMIGIGVLAAMALFVALAIFYTYRLENSNKEIDSNIYYSIK